MSSSTPTPENACTIGKADIINDGSGTWGYGNYQYRLLHNDQWVASGQVRDFPREELTAWDLIARILNDARGTRNESKQAPGPA